MKCLGVNGLREEFLSFFEKKGHKRFNSFSLIPQDDNSLLLINSGMAPLKKYFLGQKKCEGNKVTDCQKCIRTPDIDRVGITSRHGTFFEMLGNFSFGDYFKTEAIAWAWEFATEVIEIPISKIYVTVYESDDEAYNIWLKDIGVAPDHIKRLGKEDNFWEIGTGPCGPCSELYYDRGEKYYQMFRDGTLYTINVPFWSNRDSITKIVIDPSFVDGRPDTVETLFQGMRNLENIVNIQYLNTSNIAYMNGMFRGCSSLKEIDISNFDFSNTISMSSMFENCSSLMNVKLPNQLKCIGEKMFRNCSRLSSIYLPNRIDSISASAFSGCYDLKSVTVAFRVPPTISKYTFSYRANATLYVPNGSKEAFEAADYWKEFKSIEEYEYYEPGDVNMDGTVEISDVVLMVNYILGNNASETVLKYGDMNESGDIDITDVVAIVNRILGE